MTWVFKRDAGDYLHSYSVGLWGRIEEPKWTGCQQLAWRFYDRNVASSVVNRIGEAGSIKTLIPGGINKRLDEIDRRGREINDRLKAIAVVAVKADALEPCEDKESK